MKLKEKGEWRVSGREMKRETWDARCSAYIGPRAEHSQGRCSMGDRRTPWRQAWVHGVHAARSGFMRHGDWVQGMGKRRKTRGCRSETGGEAGQIRWRCMRVGAEVRPRGHGGRELLAFERRRDVEDEVWEWGRLVSG